MASSVNYFIVKDNNTLAFLAFKTICDNILVTV